MAAHRRPLVTAAIAGGLLCGLWFVPSANATGDSEQTRAGKPASTTQVGDETQQSASEARLADTGSFDTTPYLVGGLGFLGAGGLLLTHARLRSVPIRPAVR